MPGIGFQADKPFAFFTRNGCKGNSIFKEVSVRWVIVTPFVLFVVIIAFLYFHILWHMNKLSKDPVLTKFGSNCNKRKNSKRLLVTIMLLAGSAIVGWLPTLFQYVLFCQNCPVALPFEATFYVSVGAQFLNVLKFIADAFIYASRLVEVRYAIWMFHATILNYIPCCSHLKIEVPQAFNKYLSETKERRSMNSSKRIVLERMRQVGINSSFNTKSVRYVTSTPEQQSLLPIHPSSTIVTNDKKVFINRKSSFKTNIDNSQS
uniref:G_PROTEIN_RECEP_F1_2 domain-containing protein n=1 Tax=Rhabditophanes sp. KR3021 TaxID=114890 RepID=A0AC35U4W3_9BILA